VRPNLQRVTLKGIAADTPLKPTSWSGVVRSTDPESGDTIVNKTGVYQQMEIPGRTARQLTSWNLRGGYSPLTIPGRVPFISGLTVPTNGFQPPFVPPEFFPAEWGFDSNTVSGYFLKFPLRLRRVEGIFKQLEALCLLGIPVDLTTDVRWYPRMLIVGVTAPKDGTNSMEFTIQLQELRTAKTARTTVQRKQAKPVEKRAEPTAPQGKKVAGINIPVTNSGASLALDHYLGTGAALN